MVNAPCVMPNASALKVVRTLSSSSLYSVKMRTAKAYPPGDTVPLKQSLPTSGWVNVAVVAPAGGFLPAAQELAGAPHKSETAPALTTKGNPAGSSSSSEGGLLALEPQPACTAAVPTHIIHAQAQTVRPRSERFEHAAILPLNNVFSDGIAPF